MSILRLRVGVDVGGTFTDLCLFDEADQALRVVKVPSTPSDPSEGIAAALTIAMQECEAEGQDIVYFAHGTTVATNALIQHRVAPTGLLTTVGFRDLLEIGRQTRPDLYDLQVDRPEPLVRRDLRLEISERVGGDGSVITPLRLEDVSRALLTLKTAQVESVAICFLFSYLSPEHEQRVRDLVAQEFPDVYLSVSHEVMPEFREYERLSTTVVNAALGPVVSRYIAKLGQRVQALQMSAKPYITQSNGGIISIDMAQNHPVRTALSGPSTGVIGAAVLGQQVGHPNLITFDMGGTSSDVSLIEHGEPRLTTEREIEGYLVKTPMIDVHTVGAGGGSIAWIDRGGLLKVGPQSAGAAPGPVCYGQGGTEVTVTDANVALNILNPHHLLGGTMPIDAEAAHAALATLAPPLDMAPLEVARGVLSVVVANMIRAIQVVSVQRGYDPRAFSLIAFGGAGPLHAGWIARELGIEHVLIPEQPGLACASGLLVTDMRSDYTRSHLMAVDDLDLAAVNTIFADLQGQGQHWLQSEGIALSEQRLRRAVDMRYVGQNYELTIPIAGAGPIGPDDISRLVALFYEAHEQTYGYAAEGEAVQLVTFRLEAVGIVPKAMLSMRSGEGRAMPEPVDTRAVYFGVADGGTLACPVYQRTDLAPGHQLAGPAIIEQMDTTTLVLPDHHLTVDAWGTLVISLPREGDIDDPSC